MIPIYYFALGVGFGTGPAGIKIIQSTKLDKKCNNKFSSQVKIKIKI